MDDGAPKVDRVEPADRQAAGPGKTTVDDEGGVEPSSPPNPDDSFWPQFHGPRRDNISDETGLLKIWPKGGPRLLRRAEGLGHGFATVSLARGLIYTTGNVIVKNDPEKAVLTALDLLGRREWQEDIGGAWDKGPRGTRGNPTIDEDRLYYKSPSGVVACRNADTGELLWELNTLDRFGGERAFCESLLMDGDRVICCPGGPQAAVVALNKHNGEIVWERRIEGELGQFASPSLGEHNGLRMIFTTTPKAVIAVNADSGTLLWRFRHVTPLGGNVTMPIYHDGHVFVSTQGAGGVMLRIDVEGDQASVQRVWRTKDLDNHHGGMLLWDGCLYGTGSSGSGNLQCLDWKSGDQLIDQPDVKEGSLTYADGMLYCLDERLVVSLVSADPSNPVVVGQFRIPADGKGCSWAHPVVCDGRLYIRHGDYLYVYDVCAERSS